MLKKLVLALILTLMCVSSTMAREIIPGKNVNIYYDNDSVKYLAQQSVPFADSVVESVFSRLGSPNLIIKETDKIPIFLYGDFPDFRRTLLSDQEVEEGVMGFTNTIRGQIALPFPNSWPVYYHVLSHELTHAVMFKVQRKAFSFSAGHPSKETIGNYTFGKEPPGSFIEFDRLYENGASGQDNLPLWFVEGLAEYMSQKDHGDMDFYLRDAFKYDYLQNLQVLDDAPDYINTYKSGESAILFLVSRYGEPVLGDIIRNSFKGTFSMNLYNSGVSKSKIAGYSELAYSWKTSLKKKYITDLDSLAVNDIGTPSHSRISWAGTSYGTSTIFYTVAHSQIVLHDGKHILEGDRTSSCHSLHILEKGSFLYGTTLFYVRGQNYDEVWMMDIKTKKNTFLFKNNQVAEFSYPYYAGKTFAVIGRLKNGKSAIFSNNLTLYMNNDVQSLALSPDGSVIAFVGDVERKGQYYIYLVNLQTFGALRINGTLGAYDIEINKYGKNTLCFLVKDGGYTRIGVADFDRKFLRISERVANTLFFLEETYAGNLMTTAFNYGTYQNYIIDPNKVTYTEDSLTFSVGDSNATLRKDSIPNIQPVKAKTYWSFDLGQINGGYSNKFGVLGSFQVCLKTIDESKELYFLVSENALGLMYAKKEPFKNYALAFYTYDAYMWRSIDIIQERATAIFGGISYNPNYNNRYSGTLTLQLRHRTLVQRYATSFYNWASYSIRPGPKANALYSGVRDVHNTDFSRFLDFDPIYANENRGFISTSTISYVHDESRYGPFWMPLAGYRFFFMNATDYDYSHGKVPEISSIAEYVKYLYIHNTVSMAFRLAGGSSVGAYPYLFEIGGPLSIRGYDWGSITGQHYVFGNAEFRIPLGLFTGVAGLFGDEKSWLGLHHVKFRTFVDAGKVWKIWPENNSKFYMSYGFGMGGFFGYIPLNFDWVKVKGSKTFRTVFSVVYDF